MHESLLVLSGVIVGTGFTCVGCYLGAYLVKTICLAIFWMAEKVTKLTPVPYDDILLDIVWSSIKKAVKK